MDGEDLTRPSCARPAGAYGVRKCVLHFRELWIQFQYSTNVKIKKAPRSGEEPLFILLLELSKSASDFGF
jgi:hypothetical protein